MLRRKPKAKQFVRILVLIEAFGTFQADFVLVLEMINGLISGASDLSFLLFSSFFLLGVLVFWRGWWCGTCHTCLGLCIPECGRFLTHKSPLWLSLPLIVSVTFCRGGQFVVVPDPRVGCTVIVYNYGRWRKVDSSFCCETD